MVAAALVALTALQLIRQPDVPSWDTVFAEDGPIFIGAAMSQAPLDAAIEPYAGYVLIVPRLVTELGLLFGLEHAAAGLAVLSALLVSAVAVYVYFASAGLLRHAATRAALALLVAIAPVASRENTANVANLHWALNLGAFWALAAPPSGGLMFVAAVALAVSAALSDALVAMLAPLAIWRIARGGRHERVLGVAFLTALAVQLALRGDEADFERLGLTDLPEVFGIRVAGSLLVGERHLYELDNSLGAALPLLATLVLAALAVAAWRLVDGRRERFLVAACVVYALAFFAVPVWLRGGALLEVRDGAARYMYLPVVLLYPVVLVVAERLAHGRRAVATAGTALIAAVLAFGVVTSFRLPSERSVGPRWSDSLDAARATCRAPDQLVAVPNPPAARFVTRLRCEQLPAP